MASEQQERPITYGDIFAAQGYVGEQPVTREDAALMQSLESMALGSTPKGGAAAAMQSAADKNVNAGTIPPDAHTTVAVQGMQIEQTIAPGVIMQRELVAGQPVPASMAQVVGVEYPAYPVLAGDVTRPIGDTGDVTSIPGTTLPDDSMRTIPSEATEQGDAMATDPGGTMQAIPVAVHAHVVIDKPVTIGEALEAAAIGAGDSPVEDSDGRAIQSAEMRALGQINAGADSIGAIAQSAAAANEQFGTPNVQITLSNVLSDATAMLPADKVVTNEDAAKVMEAERRGRPTGDVKEGGVADCVQAAADVNTVILP